MDIALFASMLLLGMLIGKKNLAPKWLIRNSDKALTITIYVLIFLIGLEIGSYKEILSNLGNIGIKAVLIAFFSTTLSAYLTKVLSERRF
ncbi:MAG: LysO family transporter [Synergistetes bacterium]|nr:MAG: hypothetical protein XD52_1092 [bacterium 42_11]MBC7330887.1 LysO family transporter [Synergistota bacterium]MDK2870846.1 Lysine exporter LysO [bacterium]